MSAPPPAPRQRTRRLGLYFLDQAVVSGSSFLVMLLLVPYLGLEVYGAFAMVLTVALFVVGLQQALVSHPMMSIGPKQGTAGREEYYGAVLVQEAVFTVLCVLGTLLAHTMLRAIWKDDALEGTMWSVTGMVAARQAYVFLRSYFFATGRLRRALAGDLIASAGPLLALPLLHRAGLLDLPAVFWTASASFGAAVLCGLAGFERVRFRPAAILANVRRSWSFARWLGVMAVFQWFSANAFLLAAGTILGGGAVGAVKAAHNVVGVLHLGFIALENFVPVDAARVYATAGLRAMVGHLRRVFTAGLAVTVAAAAVLFLGADPLLRALYHREVNAWMVEALRGFAVLYVLTFAITVLNIAFRAVEDSRRLALCHILVALPILFAAEPTVTTFGFTGAVVGMVLQKAIVLVVLGGAFSRAARRGSFPAVAASMPPG